MGTSLDDFTRMARSRPTMRLTSLMGMLFRAEGLRDSFDRQDGKKAVGVDGERKEDFEANLDERLRDLSDRLRRMGYRPKPSLRVYIPKATGGYRPLGIPSFEDRIVQDRLSQLLQATWEPEFRDCSYGFRPGRSAHGALRRVAEIVTHERTQWIVEADIKGFFNHVCHDHLMRFLEHRIVDPNFLRVIKRFLTGGVLEDGMFMATEAGTPQGGLVSPVLSNIYLHYVLDWWFEGTFTKTCRERAHLVRYADDFVACFVSEEDARRFMEVMKERLAAFGLEVEPSKTRLLRFGSSAWLERKSGRGGKPETFDFLGFTHYVDTSKTGRFKVERKTISRRATKKLKEISQKLRAMRIEGGRAMVDFVKHHLIGHAAYYGVRGNNRALGEYFRHVQTLLHKWLNRRSQRNSISWARWWELLKAGLLPTPRCTVDLYPYRT